MNHHSQDRQAGKLFKDWKEHARDVHFATSKLPRQSEAGRIKRGWRVALRELIIHLKSCADSPDGRIERTVAEIAAYFDWGETKTRELLKLAIALDWIIVEQNATRPGGQGPNRLWINWAKIESHVKKPPSEKRGAPLEKRSPPSEKRGAPLEKRSPYKEEFIQEGNEGKNSSENFSKKNSFSPSDALPELPAGVFDPQISQWDLPKRLKPWFDEHKLRQRGLLPTVCLGAIIAARRPNVERPHAYFRRCLEDGVDEDLMRLAQEIFRKTVQTPGQQTRQAEQTAPKKKGPEERARLADIMAQSPLVKQRNKPNDR